MPWQPKKTWIVEHASRLQERIGWLRSRPRNTEILLVPLAIVTGSATGLIVTGMGMVTQFAHSLIFGLQIDVHLSAKDVVDPIVAVVILSMGGLIVGVMEWCRLRWELPNATDPVEANALWGGRLSIRDSVVVCVQTLISNGCGASVGLEAGYTQFGAGLSSRLGIFFNLRRSELRLMVGAGAAAAIAAAFDAPLTGAFYSCELIVGAYSVGSAAPILAAAISATLVVRALGANLYSLEIPVVAHGDPHQFGWMIVLALLVSLLGIAIMRAVPLVERAFSHRYLPLWLRPVLGGAIVASMATVTPQVLAAGHGAMILDFTNEMTFQFIALVVLLKTTACLVSLASGFRGGLFFASLFVGSLCGKLFAAVLGLTDFGAHINPMVSGLTAMACLGVAIVGGPLTMSFLVLEMTRNIELSATVLATCIVTSIVVRALFGHSFSTWRLHLRGETIRSANDVGWLRNLTVERLMRTDARVVSADMTIAKCRRCCPLGSSQAVFLVDSKDQYVGTVLLTELFGADINKSSAQRPVRDLARFSETTLSPTMNVREAMGCFEQAEAEVLAVIDEVSAGIVGFLAEGSARRRYVEEIESATAHVFK